MAAVMGPRSSNTSSITSSPKDAKRNLKIEENQRRDSPHSRKPSPPPSEPPAVTKVSESDGDSKATNNTATTATNAQPLAPPPRPNQNNNNNNNNNSNNEQDYFSGNHGTHFSLEPNPFEQSFGNPSVETPGKTLLPSVASLTSPAPLLPGGTPGWANSLRSGPLSPAMLTGPTGANDYFSDSHFRASFPTPNESSLRTGLTPGGGGSMFPAPSPNSQALFNSLQSGGATPSTLEFHRAALNAAAASKSNPYAMPGGGPTSQPVDPAHNNVEQKQFNPPVSQATMQDPFGQHDANDAANGLFLLARQGAPPNNAQFQAPPPPVTHGMPAAPMMANHMQQQQDTSPNMNKRMSKASLGSLSGSARGISETGEFSESGNSEPAKPATKAKGKKGGNTKAAANGRRKAEDTPAKTPANKKAKANSGMAMQQSPDFDDMDSDEEGSIKMENGEPGTSNGNKKMTDEEKRKNFLERNRVAALKCRQRKKQWLANLQAKVEIFSAENDTLSAQVTGLREEIVNLKTLLLAHKDCPVSQSQGVQNMVINQIANEFSHAHGHANPYGMAMPNGQGMPPMPQGMQRS